MRCALKTLNQHTQFTTLFFLIMSKSIALSLLAQGNNGTEILQILDTLSNENVSEGYNNEPTADVIEF